MSESWERQDGEPALWFGRFDSYRQAGERRSLVAVYRQCVKGSRGDVPPIWYDQFDRWNWRARARAWDETERTRLAQEAEAEAARARQQRIAVWRATRAKAVEQLQSMKPTDPDWMKVLATISAANRHLRTENA